MRKIMPKNLFSTFAKILLRESNGKRECSIFRGDRPIIFITNLRSEFVIQELGSKKFGTDMTFQYINYILYSTTCFNYLNSKVIIEKLISNKNFLQFTKLFFSFKRKNTCVVSFLSVFLSEIVPKKKAF